MPVGVVLKSGLQIGCGIVLLLLSMNTYLRLSPEAQDVSAPFPCGRLLGLSKEQYSPSGAARQQHDGPALSS